MRREFSDKQIKEFLSAVRRGEKLTTVAERLGLNIRTAYLWKRKFGEMTTEQFDRFRSLERQNRSLKKHLSDCLLHIQVLTDFIKTNKLLASRSPEDLVATVKQRFGMSRRKAVRYFGFNRSTLFYRRRQKQEYAKYKQ